MAYFEEKDSLFMATASSMFAFTSMFLGVAISGWYLILGFFFLAFSLKFWKKVKQLQTTHHKNLTKLFEEYYQNNS